MTVVCFKWRFKGKIGERYFYAETEKECADRIRRTYRCSDSDFEILSKQIRDEKSNVLLKEVMLNRQQSLSLVW